MANIKKMWQGLIVVIVVAAAILTLGTTAFAEDNGVRQDGAGKYAQLSAQWWQWILEQPATGNPNLDSTGAAAANGQPRQDVFFVAGTFGDTAAREFTVPANTSLFLPLLNSVGFGPLPAPQPQPDQNLVPVRMLRAVRFAAACGLEIDTATRKPIKSLAPLLANVPPSRLFDEMLMLLLSGHASECVKRLRKEGSAPRGAAAARRHTRAAAGRALRDAGVEEHRCAHSCRQAGVAGVPVCRADLA